MFYKVELIYRKLRNRGEIIHLAGLASPVCRSLSNALRDVLSGEVSAEERSWINKIEVIRDELNGSMTEVSVVDYGAGSAERGLSADEMYRGIEETRIIGEICKTASKPRLWAFLLFRIIREMSPSVCLELGTCLGISAAYQAAALKINHHGKIVTLEGAESLASLAGKNFDMLGLDNVVVVVGRFQDTLGKVLREHGPVDFAFIDGHHDEKATLVYFDQIHPFLSDNALLVFDDIAWSRGMKRAWNTIVQDRRIMVSVDLFSVGIVIVGHRQKDKKKFKIALD